MQDRERLHTYAGILDYSLDDILTLFVGICGVVCLGLFRSQRCRREYLWLGLALAGGALSRLCGIPLGLTEFAAQNGVLGKAIPLFGYSSGVQLLELLFLAELVPAEFVWVRRGFIASGVILGLPVWSGQVLLAADSSLRNTVTGFWRPEAVVPLTLALAVWFWRTGRRESAALAMWVSLQIASISYYFWTGRLATAAPPGRARVPEGVFASIALRGTTPGGLVVDLRTVAAFLISTTMLGILWRRYRREQFRLMGIELDLEAARTVQQLLLTGNDDHVDTVYRPAQEVGGDFYQVLPLADGSRLIAVGDVSGKGIRAALVVAMVVGILRTRRNLMPGRLLEEINGQLLGTMNGGFVTCLLVRLESDGRHAILANAGHLAPYSAESEVAVETGLPLGIVETEYLETTGQFEALMLLSDGVVEAAKPDGELFGFERTREISGRSAGEIADAAIAWGQNDDITVVTVGRAG